MLPYNSGRHADYQDTFVSGFLKFYPDLFVLSKDTWDYIIQFWYLDLPLTDSIIREKEDYKLKDGRHRSTKMWYCRLYGIMMLQHLDAWEMPSAEAFQELLLCFTA